MIQQTAPIWRLNKKSLTTYYFENVFVRKPSSFCTCVWVRTSLDGSHCNDPITAALLFMLCSWERHNSTIRTEYYRDSIIAASKRLGKDRLCLKWDWILQSIDVYIYDPFVDDGEGIFCKILTSLGWGPLKPSGFVFFEKRSSLYLSKDLGNFVTSRPRISSILLRQSKLHHLITRWIWWSMCENFFDHRHLFQ